jgi:hypothetical protein
VDAVTSTTKERLMKPLILSLVLAGAALSGCAQLQGAFAENADAGATGVENQRPYPKSSSDLGLF